MLLLPIFVVAGRPALNAAALSAQIASPTPAPVIPNQSNPSFLVTFIIAGAASIVTLIGAGVLKWWDNDRQNKATIAQFVGAIDAALVGLGVAGESGHQARVERACDRVMTLALSTEFAKAVHNRKAERIFQALGAFEQNYLYIVDANRLRDEAFAQIRDVTAMQVIVDDNLREKNNFFGLQLDNAVKGIVTTAPDAIKWLRAARAVIIPEISEDP